MKKLLTSPLFFISTLSMIALLSCRSKKEPEFLGFSNIRITEPGIRESVVLLDLDFMNPNKFALQLKSASCSVFVEKQYLGLFQLDSVITIMPNSGFTLPLSGKVDMAVILKISLNFAFKQEINITVEGTGRIGKGGIFANYCYDNLIMKHQICK